MFPNHLARADQCRHKMALSVRSARYAWQTWRETRDMAWHHLAREAMRDARYWKRQLENIAPRLPGYTSTESTETNREG